MVVVRKYAVVGSEAEAENVAEMERRRLRFPIPRIGFPVQGTGTLPGGQVMPVSDEVVLNGIAGGHTA